MTDEQETLRKLTEQMIAWAEALDAFEEADAQEDAAPSEGFISAHRAMKRAEELYHQAQDALRATANELRGGVL